jgi:hypothetical protein
MMTGNTGLNDLGRLVSWNGLSKLNNWNNLNANTFKGTFGSISVPFKTRDEAVYSFVPDMCRSLRLEYSNDNLIGNINTYDFKMPKNSFHASNPEFKDFCENDSLGDGVFNVKKCLKHSSSYLSQPHFLNADKKFLNAISGLKPNEKAHESVFNFQPITGVSIAGNIRFQLNFYVRRNEDIDLTKYLNASTLLPFVWFDEHLRLDSDIMEDLASIDENIFYANIINMSVLVAGILLWLFTFLFRLFKLFQFKKRKRKENSKIEQNKSPEKTVFINLK